MKLFNVNFNELLKDLTRRIETRGVSLTEWEDGYTSDDVEEILDNLQSCLKNMQLHGELVMIWNRLDKSGMYPAGDSEVWILAKLSDGYVGAPISTPFIANEGLESCLKDVIDFNEGTLELKPVSFIRFSRYNVLLNH